MNVLRLVIVGGMLISVEIILAVISPRLAFSDAVVHEYTAALKAMETQTGGIIVAGVTEEADALFDASAAIKASEVTKHLPEIIEKPIASTSQADALKLETAVLHVKVNGEDQGDHFFELDQQGGVWSKPDTLKQLGLSGIQVLEMQPEDQSLSLASLKKEMRYKLDMNNGELDMMVQPEWLSPQQIFLTEERQNNSEMLRENSTFLNYNFNYGWSQSSTSKSVSLPLELGVRLGDVFFSTNADYTNLNQARKHWLRTQSQLLWDDSDHLLRVTAGDVVSSTGAAGIGATLGGVTVTRAFGLKPYQVNTPKTSFNLLLPTASEIKVYINGNLIKMEHVAPGPLSLKDLPLYEGHSDVEIVVRDAFGRETRHKIPYYFSSQLLAPGLSDFSYSLGVPQQRNTLGELVYTGSPVLMGFHRIGVSDGLTGGAHAAYKGGAFNAGLSASLITGTVGDMNLLLMGSSVGTARGVSGSMRYSLTAWNAFSPNVFVSAATPAYRTVLQTTSSPQSSRWEVGTGLGFGLFGMGNISGNYRHRWRQDGVRERKVSAFYSARLFANIGLTMAGRWRSDSVNHHTQSNYSMGMNYTSKNGISLSVNGDRNDGVLSVGMQIQLNPPVGEGYGVALQTRKREFSKRLESSARVTWRNRYSEMDISRVGDNKSGSYLISGRGALALLDHSIYMSRPISGGFALVRTKGMANIPVSNSNQLVGHTNSKGELLVPNLIAYNENDLSIDAGSMPMSYQVDFTSRNISVPFHGGAVVDFGVQKFQSIEGTLFIQDAQGEKDAAFYGLELIKGDQKQTAVVGYGGAFYIENMHTGEYQARLFNEQRDCQFMMRVPESDEVFIKLGKLVCTMDKEKTHD
ncbi:fimbrial biogenesis outer membrane usher protein [Mariprofundus ferrooxydans]|nr:fimbrial biogenesis outer membrane usher protein [Mariprofundus ferrooxydans]